MWNRRGGLPPLARAAMSPMRSESLPASNAPPRKVSSAATLKVSVRDRVCESVEDAEIVRVRKSTVYDCLTTEITRSPAATLSKVKPTVLAPLIAVV